MSREFNALNKSIRCVYIAKNTHETSFRIQVKSHGEGLFAIDIAFRFFNQNASYTFHNEEVASFCHNNTKSEGTRH